MMSRLVLLAAVLVVALATLAVQPTEAVEMDHWGRVRSRGRLRGGSPPPAAPTPPSPSWKCRVCEDVVQTWHDRFKCAGSSLAMESTRPNPFSPKAESTPFQSCRQPRLDCHDLNEHLKPVCIAMRYQFITRKEKHIWSTIMGKGNIYDTCIGLGKCINDTVQTDAKVCRDSFKEPSCRDHVTCAPVQKACSSSCFLCYHLVRDWPLFQQTCKPEGAKVDAEAHLDEEKAQLSSGDKPAPVKSPPGGGSSFLEQFMHKNGKAIWLKRQHMDRELLQRQQDMADRLAGPFGAAPVKPGANQRSDYFEDDLLSLLAVETEVALQTLNDRAPVEDSEELASEPLTDASTQGSGNPYDSLDDAQATLENEYNERRRLARERADAREQERQMHHQMLVEIRHKQQQLAAARAASIPNEADGPPPKIPVQNSDTLPLKCHDMWDSIRYSKKARFFVQWKEEVCILPSGQDRMKPAGLWDANVVCKCLGHCELSQFEYLGLEDVCKYGPPEQRTIDMALGPFMRDKPHTAVSNDKGDDDPEEHQASGGSGG